MRVGQAEGEGGHERPMGTAEGGRGFKGRARVPPPPHALAIPPSPQE